MEVGPLAEDEAGERVAASGRPSLRRRPSREQWRETLSAEMHPSLDLVMFEQGFHVLLVAHQSFHAGTSI